MTWIMSWKSKYCIYVHPVLPTLEYFFGQIENGTKRSKQCYFASFAIELEKVGNTDSDTGYLRGIFPSTVVNLVLMMGKYSSNTLYFINFKHKNRLLVLIDVCPFHHHHLGMIFPQISLILTISNHFQTFLIIFKHFKHFSIHFSTLLFFNITYST